MKHICDMEDWDRETQAAGSDLVVVEVRGSVVGTHTHRALHRPSTAQAEGPAAGSPAVA